MRNISGALYTGWKSSICCVRVVYCVQVTGVSGLYFSLSLIIRLNYLENKAKTGKWPRFSQVSSWKCPIPFWIINHLTLSIKATTVTSFWQPNDDVEHYAGGIANRIPIVSRKSVLCLKMMIFENSFKKSIPLASSNHDAQSKKNALHSFLVLS